MLVWALAQAAATVAPLALPVADPGAPGVISYPPSFFAALNPNSANDMLGRIPGFSLDSGSGVRGFEGSAGNVLIDGQRPSSKSDSVDQVLTRIPASRVERIDIVRGGAPGIDMQGKTVIANVITRKGASTRGLLAMSNYLLTDNRYFVNNARAEASGSSGDRTWELAGRIGSGPDDAVSTGRSVLIRANGAAGQTALLDTKGLAYNGSLTAAGETPLFGGRLRLNGRYFQDKFKEPETDRIIAPAPDLQSFGFVQKTTDTEVGGRFSRPFGAATDVEFVGLRTTRRRDVDSSSQIHGTASDFLNGQDSSEAIVRGVIKRRFGTTISTEAGAESAVNRLTSRTGFIVGGAAVAVPAANVRVEEQRSEAFVKATWRPAPRWTLNAGLRYESSDISSAGDVVLSKSLQFAKPRVQLSWQATDATQIRVRYEREVGQLDFNAFVASSSLASGVGISAGNPDLDPQQAWASEVTVEQRLWADATVVVTGRHYELSDVVDRGPVFAPDGAVFDRPTNIGAGTEDDISLDATLPFGALGWQGLMLKGGATRRWTAVRDPTTGERREISGAHPIDWSFSVIQDMPARKLNAGVDVYGEFRRTYYRFNLIETIKIQTYVRPYIEWKPTAAWSLRWEAPLATAPDVRYRDTLQIFPGPRRPGVVPDVQDRQFHFPRGVYFRVLRNFG